MDEHIKPEIGRRLPERTQTLRIELLPLNLGCNDDPGKAELNRAALEFGGRRLRIERRHMREPDEAAGIIPLRLVHAVVDQAAGGEVGLIEALPQESTAMSMPAWSIIRTCAGRSASSGLKR